MDDSEILEDPDINQIAAEILERGKKVKDTSLTTVFLGENYVVSIPSSERTEDLKRLCTRVPSDLYPELYVRTIDTESLGRKTVILRERSDYTLENALEAEGLEKIDDMIELMDSLVYQKVAMVDPNPDNFRYYSGDLKISDIADEDSIQSFPESYRPEKGVEQFTEDVTEMFISAAFESSHYLDKSGEEVLEYIKQESNTGKHLDTADKVQELKDLRDSDTEY